MFIGTVVLCTAMVFPGCGAGSSDSGIGSDSGSDCTLPATPTGLKVSQHQATFLMNDLSWNPVSGATSYSVKNSTTPDVTWADARLSQCGLTGGTSCSEVSHHAVDYYAVSAHNSCGDSDLSVSVKVTNASISSDPTGSDTTSTTGQLSIWTNHSAGIGSVYVDGVSVGGLTQSFTTGPACGASGTISKTLAAGTHTVKATASNYSWPASTTTIKAGMCTTYELLGINSGGSTGGGGTGGGGTCTEPALIGTWICSTGTEIFTATEQTILVTNCSWKNSYTACNGTYKYTYLDVVNCPNGTNAKGTSGSYTYTITNAGKTWTLSTGLVCNKQ